MPLQYNHKDASNAWPEANYPAVLISVEDAVSKTSGNPMEVWTFEVFNDATGKKQELKDYVSSNAIFKIKQLAMALGQMADFKANKFHAEAWINSNVMLGLIIEDDPQYGEKNRIGRISAVPGSPVPPVASHPAAPAPTGSRRVSAAERILNAPVETIPADTQVMDDASIPF